MKNTEGDLVTPARDAVLETFKVHGPMTDADMIEKYAGPRHSDRSLVRRRVELMSSGLIADTGHRKEEAVLRGRKRQSIVWRATQAAWAS